MRKEKCCNRDDDLRALEDKLSGVMALLSLTFITVLKILVKENKIMADLTRLEAEVGETKTVAESAVVLLDGLKAALEAAGTDPVKLAELADALDASGNALAEAVARNTPAA